MFSKKTALIAGLFFLIAVCITGLSVSGRRGYSSYGSDMLLFVSPVQETATDSMRFVRNLWNHYFFLVSKSKENDRLKRELNLVVQDNNQCNEIKRSNFRLRNLLNFRRTINERVLAAEIISKDPCPWFKSVHINKGRADGIKEGMPVIIPEGIVGVVTDVSYFYSKVVLIIDRNCAVDALVQRTRARGIIKGISEENCYFKYVLRKHDIREGDIVVSSGLDRVFPKGLRVGIVSKATRSNSGIFQEVIVTPYVDFEKLEEVLVVADSPEYDQFASKQ